MVENKTIVIVGAGAGQEVGLPIGSGLKRKIAKLLNFRFQDGHRISGDVLIQQALGTPTLQAESGINNNNYLQTARFIRGAMPLAESIDNFIYDHNGNKLIEYCGKLAIVRSILDTESTGMLYFDFTRDNSSFDHNAIENTWFNKFFKILTVMGGWPRVRRVKQRPLNFSGNM